MSFETRKYQTAAAKAAYEAKKPILIVSPGSSGKTWMIVMTARRARRDKKRVLVISHREEIIDQTIKTLKEAKMASSILMGKRTSEVLTSIVVASIATVNKRKHYPEADVVIIDEAHRSTAKSYLDLIDHYLKKGAKVIGFTATPHRLTGEALGDVYDKMYVAAQPSELLGKYIMKPLTVTVAPEYLPDLVGLESARGDFKINDLVKRMNKAGLVGGIVKAAKKWLKGRKTVLFACSIAHSKKVCAELVKAGFKAVHVDGNMSSSERQRVLDSYNKGKIQIICCCLLLTEGWDVPTCEAVIMARPTRSLALYFQMSNRCTRFSDRMPIIIDHACNTVTHEHFVWEDREWSLEGKAVGTVDKDGSALEHLRICTECWTINEAGAKVCENEDCGADLVKHRLLSPREREEMELVEWTKKEKARRMKKLKEFAVEHGLPQSWIDRAEELWVVA